MRRWGSILLLLITLFTLVGVAQAQSTVGFETLDVLLWPEYDRPEMLVIYRITLSDSTRLPAQFDLRIPRAAGSPYTVAVEESDGQLYNLDYTTEPDGEWLVVSLTAPTQKLQIEYYDPGLSKNGDRREFEYRWNGDVEIYQMTIQVQQPLTASDLQVTPDMGSWQVGSDDLRYYTEDVGSVPAGTPLTLKVSYTKSDDTLSVPDQVPLEPSQPIGSSTSELRLQEAMPFILGTFGIALIISGGLWFWLISRKRHAQELRQHFLSEDLPDESDQVFCHRCGKRATPEDVFCRACGTRLRRD